MTLDYQKVWSSMNELESTTSKICSAREILDSAIDALENRKKGKAETLMYAVDEYLQYYLEEFDRKFKDAWNETVTKLNQEKADDYMRPQGHSDMEALSQHKEDKVVKWQLPVEEDTVSGEYFITFPEDLLEAANLKEGDDVEWISQEAGTFILKKCEKQLNHDEAIAAGWTTTDDSF